MQEHQQLVDEFEDTAKWPKHLVVEYRWVVHAEDDAESGIFVLMATCAPCNLRF